MNRFSHGSKNRHIFAISQQFLAILCSKLCVGMVTKFPCFPTCKIRNSLLLVIIMWLNCNFKLAIDLSIKLNH